MEQRESRVSIAISSVTWTGQRDSSGAQVHPSREGETSPKEETTFQQVELEGRDSDHHHRSGGPTPLPLPPALPEIPPAPHLSGTMMEPITRPASVAVGTLPRHNSLPPPFHPTTPTDLRTPETTVPKLTTRQKALLPFKRLLRIPSSISARRKHSARKRDAEERATQFVVYTLLLFCVSAISYIALAFSLPNFPNFLHIVFIGILFIEFACVIKSLFNRTRITRKKLHKANTSPRQEGPPPGAIIQGALNWEDSEDIPETEDREGFDLEGIGREEALKPVPPAYGMYRGSVRIGDHDIRWVRRVEITGESLTEGEGETIGEDGVMRPPSYASDRAGIV